MNQLTAGSVKAKELVNWMNFPKTGCPILYLGVTVLLNWAACIVVDYSTNYPMGRARVETLVKKVVMSLVRCLKPRAIHGYCFCRRRPTRNANAGRCAGEPMVEGLSNQPAFRPLGTSSGEGFKVKGKLIDCNGLHVKVRSHKNQ